MSLIALTKRESIAQIVLQRGKVNAINAEMLAELRRVFEDLRTTEPVRAVLLTGRGSFFSFGFDVPELLTYSRERLVSFLADFNAFLQELFLFPKPVVAAINGHATAGGCMLAICCDDRLIVDARARMSLNEINIGVPVFSGITAILQQCVGARMAEWILMDGAMYTSEEALRLGLVDQIVPPEDLLSSALKRAESLGAKCTSAFAQVKRLSRSAAAKAARGDAESIERFVDIWMSPQSQKLLRTVTIRE
ncbi:MAG: enoyl-CoA hydratase/isomerase family protein [candidate division Zixibacteria bacterium]|jgi:enoyl-CoA hydratase/carnithine racemase|nr:enoyl-CoA hydratase/isomerase family protein [candidate division Zixibacteria bacterium]